MRPSIGVVGPRGRLLGRVGRRLPVAAAQRPDQAERAQRDQAQGHRPAQRRQPDVNRASDQPPAGDQHEDRAEGQGDGVGTVPFHRDTSRLPALMVRSRVSLPGPTPSVSLSVIVCLGLFRPSQWSPRMFALPTPTLALTTTSTLGGSSTRRLPAPTLTLTMRSWPSKLSALRSRSALPRLWSYRSSSSAIVTGAQVTSPAEPCREPTSPTALLLISTTESTTPSTMSPRVRPNHAPISRPRPTTASARAT